MTSFNAPSARDRQGAVWTGTEMIVWGGFDWTAGAPVTGALYSPASDTWRPMSTLNAPDGRAWPVAAWTGDVLVIWGGEDFYSLDGMDTGGIYDPLADSWSDVPTQDAPGARFLSVSVWTGDELIVWGGQRYFQIVDDGGRLVVPSSPDADQDGYRVCSGDCDDSQSSVYPGAPQLCDGINNDCSSSTWPTIPPDELDSDGDGYRTCDGDCDDTNPSIHPGAIDLPGNAIDEDCDGTPTCDPGGTWVNHGQFVLCVSRACGQLVRAGLIDQELCDELTGRAGRSSVGSPRRGRDLGPPEEP